MGIKRTIVWVGCSLAFSNCPAQKTTSTNDLLFKLDSIAKSPSVSRHFAAIYFETTVGALDFFSHKEERIQQLMERLELKFADYFFQSAIAYRDNDEIANVWKAYYADSASSQLSYLLYGINAHINGDIWQALTTSLTVEEMEEIKPHYFSYQRQLLKDYANYYSDALETNKRIKAFHAASFGFDRWYGRILLKRWRKRQMKLAEIYFKNPALFEKKRAAIQRKMDHLNELIRKNISR